MVFDLTIIQNIVSDLVSVVTSDLLDSEGSQGASRYLYVLDTLLIYSLVWCFSDVV